MRRDRSRRQEAVEAAQKIRRGGELLLARDHLEAVIAADRDFALVATA